MAQGLAEALAQGRRLPGPAVGLAQDFHNALGKAGGGLQLRFQGLEARAVGEGDDGHADVVVQGAVGQIRVTYHSPSVF